jgi:hypothetical protein
MRGAEKTFGLWADFTRLAAESDVTGSAGTPRPPVEQLKQAARRAEARGRKASQSHRTTPHLRSPAHSAPVAGGSLCTRLFDAARIGMNGAGEG